MNNLFKVSALMCSSLMAIAFSSCSTEEISKDSQLKVSNATTITTSDMVGHWDLTGMIADTPVDLNDDNTSSENLLDETSCFNTMSITFNENGTFISNNAQMTFESGTTNDQFSCLADRMDSGDWVVRNDSLILTLEINATIYTHKKLISLGDGSFGLDVTKLESNQYVNDPGDTQASPIRILEVEYTKS